MDPAAFAKVDAAHERVLEITGWASLRLQIGGRIIYHRALLGLFPPTLQTRNLLAKLGMRLEKSSISTLKSGDDIPATALSCVTWVIQTNIIHENLDSYAVNDDISWMLIMLENEEDSFEPRITQKPSYPSHELALIKTLIRPVIN